MTELCGKGIWLAHAGDLQRAAEMTTRIGGDHLIVKVGHGPYYFPETAREHMQRARTLGLSALGWIQLTPKHTRATKKAIVAALELGYQAVVLFAMPGLQAGDQLRLLAEDLVNIEVPTDRLFLASPPPDILNDRETLEALVPVCQAGWMPLCFSAWGEDAGEMIDRKVFHALDELSLLWGKTPEVYPVLSPSYGISDDARLPERFIPWIEAVARHGVDFFSIYHAAAAQKVLWPMLQAVNVPCMETGGRARLQAENMVIGGQEITTIPQPVYITAGASDTVMGIISRHGLKRDRFWEWNAHLWDSRGLPRDPDYLQAGWRVRVK